MPSAEHNVLARTVGFFRSAFRSFRITLAASKNEESETFAVKGVNENEYPSPTLVRRQRARHSRICGDASRYFGTRGRHNSPRWKQRKQCIFQRSEHVSIAPLTRWELRLRSRLRTPHRHNESVPICLPQIAVTNSERTGLQDSAGKHSVYSLCTTFASFGYAKSVPATRRALCGTAEHDGS